MKRTKTILAIILAVAMLLSWNVIAGENDRFSDINLTADEKIDIPEIAAPSGDPITNRGWLYVKDSGGTSNLYFEADDGTVTDLLRDAETVAATNAIAATECGKTFYLSAGTEFQSTLPALSGVNAGCEMRFVIAAAASGANYTIITGNSLENQINGLISVNSTHVACAGEDTITLVDGNSVGDWVQLESDGTSWFITGETFTAAKLTCTQAD